MWSRNHYDLNSDCSLNYLFHIVNSPKLCMDIQEKLLFQTCRKDTTSPLCERILRFIEQPLAHIQSLEIKSSMHESFIRIRSRWFLTLGRSLYHWQRLVVLFSFIIFIGESAHHSSTAEVWKLTHFDSLNLHECRLEFWVGYNSRAGPQSCLQLRKMY